MLAQLYSLSSETPTEIVPTVDADYEVIVTFDGGVVIGGPSMTGTGAGEGGCLFAVMDAQGFSVVTLRLKVGDSLYALANGGNTLGVFAQPL